MKEKVIKNPSMYYRVKKRSESLPKFVLKSLDNSNELTLRHTDDIQITCLGIQYDYTNENGEKFSVIVSDSELVGSEVVDRINWCQKNKRMLSSIDVYNEYKEKESELN